MKNQILIFTIVILAMVSCKKDDPVPVNNFKGTKWTARDDIAELIFGGNCTTSIEFLTETTCQEIDIIKGSSFNNTKVTQETYTYKNDSVTWTSGNIKISGNISGSVLSSDMGTIGGSQRIYTKDK